jgi:hypothetical protein
VPIRKLRLNCILHHIITLIQIRALRSLFLLSFPDAAIEELRGENFIIAQATAVPRLRNAASAATREGKIPNLNTFCNATGKSVMVVLSLLHNGPEVAQSLEIGPRTGAVGGQ